jgi:Sec-independent protein translocase protein TatA
MGSLSPWHIALVVVVGFLIFGVGGSKKLFRKGANRVKDTGSGIKGAAQELQTSMGEEANTDSAIYQATVAGKEKAAAVGTSALDAAKEARESVASLADDAKSSAGGSEPQTAVGRATRAVTESARDIREGVTNEEHEPQSTLGKAAKSAGDAAKSRVDMLGDTANAFKEGVEGQPEPAVAADPAALPAAASAPAADATAAPAPPVDPAAAPAPPAEPTPPADKP